MFFLLPLGQNFMVPPIEKWNIVKLWAQFRCAFDGASGSRGKSAKKLGELLKFIKVIAESNALSNSIEKT